MATRSDPGHAQEGTDETPTPGGGAQATRERVQQGRGRPRKSARSERELMVTIANVEKATTTTRSTIEQLSPLFTLVVPNELLLEVHSSRSGNYIEVVNDHIEGGVLLLDNTSARLQKCMETEAGRLHSRVTKAGGSRKRETLLQGNTCFVVGKGEAVNVRDYSTEMEFYKKSIEEELEGKEMELEALILLAEEAQKEAEERETDTSGFMNRGKQYSEVSSRQKRRQLHKLRDFTAKALLFYDSFGLTPENVTCSLSSGESLAIAVGDSASPSGISPSITAEQRDGAKQVLYLLDRFGVSDEFYHELAQTNQTLPRLHHVKQARSMLNSSVDFTRLEYGQGVYLNLRHHLTAMLAYTLEQTDSAVPDSILVKFAGDGARFSSASNFIFLTFSFPTVASDALAASGNYTFAAVKGQEKYTYLNAALAPVWQEMNNLLGNPYICIGTSHTVRLDIVLGSDYKFLLNIMGMNEAFSIYACVWCEIKCSERWNMSLEESDLQFRSLESIRSNSTYTGRNVHKRKGCKHPPLLDLEPQQLIIDELHLLLRVGDVLLRNVILQAHALDREHANFSGADTGCVGALQQLVRSCGVSFAIHERRDANGKPIAGTFEWTALDRRQKLAVLQHLPEKLQAIFPQASVQAISSLWKGFLELYTTLSSKSDPTESEIMEFQLKAKQWVNSFLELGQSLQGYQKANVTPYIHFLVYHCPSMMKQYGSLRKFSGQGVEKNNDSAKRNFYSSNRHDPCLEVLRAENRLIQTSSEGRREKRTYTKHDSDYWGETIFQIRKRPRDDDI